MTKASKNQKTDQTINQMRENSNKRVEQSLETLGMKPVENEDLSSSQDQSKSLDQLTNSKSFTTPANPKINTIAGKEVFGYKLASPAIRFLAFLIDFFIVAFVFSFVIAFIPYEEIVIFGTVFVYFAYAESLERSATIGKQIMKIKTISSENGAALGDISYLRSVLKILSIFTLGIGFFLALFDPRYQALYDRYCKTFVVKNKE